MESGTIMRIVSLCKGKSTDSCDEGVSGVLKSSVSTELDWHDSLSIFVRIGPLLNHSACISEYLPGGHKNLAAKWSAAELPVRVDAVMAFLAPPF